MSANTVYQVNHPPLFEGLLTRAQLQAETGWGVRTILRREAEGLPVIRAGATKLYPRDDVRQWLMSRKRDSATAAPRRPGRPRKNT